MKRTILVGLFFAAPASGMAHTSLVPHDHPHGPSMLADAALLLAAALLGIAVIFYWHRRRSK